MYTTAVVSIKLTLFSSNVATDAKKAALFIISTTDLFRKLF